MLRTPVSLTPPRSLQVSEMPSPRIQAIPVPLVGGCRVGTRGRGHVRQGSSGVGGCVIFPAQCLAKGLPALQKSTQGRFNHVLGLWRGGCQLSALGKKGRRMPTLGGGPRTCLLPGPGSLSWSVCLSVPLLLILLFAETCRLRGGVVGSPKCPGGRPWQGLGLPVKMKFLSMSSSCLLHTGGLRQTPPPPSP